MAKPSPQRASGTSSQPPTNEWVRVKRNRSTLEERIQKRCALLAHAQILVRKAQEMQKEEVIKISPRSKQIWMPKAKSTPKAKASNVAPQPSSTSNPASSAITPSVKPYDYVDLSNFRNLLKGRLGLLHEDQGKAPIKECLGPLKEPRATIQIGVVRDLLTS